MLLAFSRNLPLPLPLPLRRSLTTFHVVIPPPPPSRIQTQSVQIPLLYDFWGAANRPAQEHASKVNPDPVMLTVAGSATHLNEPSHKLYQPTDHLPPQSSFSEFTGTLGQLANAFGALRNEYGSAQQDVRPVKRDLTGEERRGLYMLLGLFGTIWVATGFF